MNIVVGSAFRNSVGRLEVYFGQIAALRSLAATAGYSVRVVSVYGDCRDRTDEHIREIAKILDLDVELIECSHGGPVYGSTEQVTRMNDLSKVGNAILSGVKPEDDVLVYVESDLVWDPATIMALVSMVSSKTEGFDVIAPLVFAGQVFYDIWAFRKNGVRFSPFPPYHPELKTEGITEVDSVGSCPIMSGKVARNVRIQNGNALVGWSDQARQQGYKIGVHAASRIYHP